MKAIIVDKDTHALSWQNVPDPIPKAGEVLIQVHAAGVNRADLSQRAGHYPPPPGASEILGLEVSGTVAQLGPNVSGAEVGQAVCALLSGGGYAEYVAVPAGLLMPIPEGWSMVEAAGLPEVFLTAYLNLFLEAGLQKGETVLIHGGASGVGTAAIQLAHEAGAQGFATAGTPEKVHVCETLGAAAFNYKAVDFAEAIREQTDGVDVILDMVGQDYFAYNLGLLRTSGRMVVIATLSGAQTDLDLRQLMGKRLTLKGSTLRSRPLEERAKLTEAFVERFGSALAEGRLKPVLDTVIPVEEADKAHRRMQGNLNIGKLILQIFSRHHLVGNALSIDFTE